MQKYSLSELKEKILILRPIHSGRLRQDSEAENKFQEEFINPALLLHRFLVAYYTFTNPVMIIIITIIIRRPAFHQRLVTENRTVPFRLCSD